MSDRTRLDAESPEILALLEELTSDVGSLDLGKAAGIPDEVLSRLRSALGRVDGFLRALFDLRGEGAPSPEPGVPFASLGPSLRRTLPQRLAAQLEDELNALSGSGLDAFTDFAALGLFARVADLFRFVDFLEEERTAAIRRAAPPTLISVRRPAPATKAAARSEAPATAISPRRAAPRPPRSTAGIRRTAAPPPAPSGPGPDLSAYDIRIDEKGERVDEGRLSAWFAASPGPGASAEGLAASFAVPFPGGIALAVADGAESSLGARLAAVVAVRTFCRAAAAGPPAAAAALRTVQQHLDMLLSALLTAGDGSVSLAKVRGTLVPESARRILAHTRTPEEALRRVAPALATSFVGAVAVPSRGGCEVSAFRLGPGSAELKAGGRVADVFGPPPPGAPPLLAPGPRGAEGVGRVEAASRLTLAPGDALLLATSAVAKGSAGAWAAISTIAPALPQGLGAGDSCLELLRRAARWGEAEPPSFGGPLGIALLLAR